MVYRSRAVQPLSKQELRQLTIAAQARNTAEHLTGLVVYHEQCFFQWLEGPAESLDRVMQSIRCDTRHTDVQVLDAQPTTVRHFGDWTMKLATPIRGGTPWRREVIDPPRDVLAGLDAQPDAAPRLLLRMVPQARTAEIVRDVFLCAVVPELLARHGLGRPAARESAVSHLAQMLLLGDTTAASAFIAAAAKGRPVHETLIDPAARHLGDLWAEDACSEAEVTLGLCCLQTALRRSEPADPAPVFIDAPPTVLVAPAPGEPHGVGAAIAADALWRVGWAPSCAYPRDDADMQDMLAGTCFDAVDLSLSPAFTREQRLPRLAETIARARQSSRNPFMAVVVSGRIFHARPEAMEFVGADAVRTTAPDAPAAVWRGLRRTAGGGALLH